jgi:hypothetical protein
MGLLANRGRRLEADEQGDGEQDGVEDAVQRGVAGAERREGVTGVAALGDDRDGQDQERDQGHHGEGEHAADGQPDPEVVQADRDREGDDAQIHHVM